MHTQLLLVLLAGQVSPAFNTPSVVVDAFSDEIGLVDLNSDGHLDVVTAGNGIVSTLLGDGVGRVAPHGKYPNGQIIVDLDVGDLSGDGLADVVTLNQKSFSLLRGDGVGGLIPSSSKSFSGMAGDVAIGDVDGDGDLDVIVGTQLPSQALVVGLNDGTGSMTLQFVATGFGIEVIELADITGDGTLDVVASSDFQHYVTVLSGDGSGGFSTVFAEQVPIALPIDTLSVADMDDDGDADVVVGSGGVFTSYLGDATGQLVLTGSKDTGGAFSSASLLDMTGDSIPDLVNASAKPTVFEGSGTGLFGVGRAVLCGDADEVSPGDMNGDGRLDLAYVSVAGSITVVLQDEFGRFGGDRYQGPGAIGSAMFDVDQDGDKDYLMAFLDENDVRLSLSDGAGGFSPGPSIPIPSTSVHDHPNRLFHGDLNNDGIEDLIVRSQSQVQVGIGSGSGTFLHWKKVLGGNISPTFVDLDNDGILDLAAHGITSTVGFSKGLGNGQFTSVGAAVFVGATTSNTGDRVIFADANNDGNLDMMSLSGDVRVHLGDGAFGFSQAIPSPYGSPALGKDITAGDLDGDGSVDLVVLSVVADSYALRVLFGSGQHGTFSVGGSYEIAHPFFSGNQHHIVLRDMDGDSDLDIVAIADGFSARYSVLWNDGAGLFSDGGTYALGRYPRALYVDDVDGDGVFDVIGSQRDVAFGISPTSPCGGGFTEYGQGCVGTGGFVPHLTGHGCPTSGGLIKIGVTNGNGGGVALMLLGGASASAPLAQSCSLLLGNLAPVVIPIPLGGMGAGTGQFELNAWLPPGLPQGQLYLQVFSEDLLVPAGYSASNGLAVNLQ